MAKMEQARVVAVVSLVEKIPQTCKSIGSVADAAQTAIFLDAPVLGDAQKDDPVNGTLHRFVQFANCEGISKGDVSCQGVTPTLDLFQKGAVYLGGATLRLVGFRILVEGTFENGVLGKERGDLVPFFGILPEGVILDAGFVRLVFLIWFDPAVIDGQLFKIGDDGEGQLGGPGVTAHLKGGSRVILDNNGRFLCFNEKFAGAANAE